MRGIGAGTRIFELLDRKPAIAPNQGIDVDPSRRGVIRFENVGFEYPSRKGVQILDDFNLELGVGENVAIVYVFRAFRVYVTEPTDGLAARAVEASRQFSRSSFGITTLCVAKSRLMDKVRPFTS